MGILREKFFLIVENIHVAQFIKERLLKCIVKIFYSKLKTLNMLEELYILNKPELTFL